MIIGRAGNPANNPVYVPIFASGYPTIIQSLTPGGYTAGAVGLTLGVLITLCVAKVIATAAIPPDWITSNSDQP